MLSRLGIYELMNIRWIQEEPEFDVNALGPEFARRAELQDEYFILENRRYELVASNDLITNGIVNLKVSKNFSYFLVWL